ncbi:hypothetical protein HK101_004541 [Irineochytrium annulatum]|nr:hypothetical protein HK101_004541 [Irineochytrium annulatum]
MSPTVSPAGVLMWAVVALLAIAPELASAQFMVAQGCYGATNVNMPWSFSALGERTLPSTQLSSLDCGNICGTTHARWALLSPDPANPTSGNVLCACMPTNAQQQLVSAQAAFVQPLSACQELPCSDGTPCGGYDPTLGLRYFLYRVNVPASTTGAPAAAPTAAIIPASAPSVGLPDFSPSTASASLQSPVSTSNPPNSSFTSRPTAVITSVIVVRPTPSGNASPSQNSTVAPDSDDPNGPPTAGTIAAIVLSIVMPILILSVGGWWLYRRWQAGRAEDDEKRSAARASVMTEDRSFHPFKETAGTSSLTRGVAKVVPVPQDSMARAPMDIRVVGTSRGWASDLGTSERLSGVNDDVGGARVT